MNLREVTLDDGKRAVPLHERLTVLAGLDDGRRAELIEVLSAEVLAGQGVEEAGVDVVLRPGDLPRDPTAEPQPDPDGRDGRDGPAATAVEHAAAQERAAADDVEQARAALDPEARASLAAAEAVEAGAAGTLAAAQARLTAAENAVRASEEQRAEFAARKVALDARRADAAAAVAEARRLDTDAVADALAAYRRLQSVKRRPSARAAALADRWAAYRARQRGELPGVEPPPEYLVAPARAALEAARAAVEEAEGAGEAQVEIDVSAVEELERAHRRVLEAEQRTNLRPSRLNRRRLEGAQQGERQALTRLGVRDYGEYLSRIVPVVRSGGGARSLEAARAALADAEAVWDELHGGVPPLTDEEVSATLATIRAEAEELLGEDPGDEAMEDRLRSHLEQVVDVEWAREALLAALADVGGDGGAAATATSDLESLAEDWLAGTAGRRARVQELEAALAAIDEELAALVAEGAQREPDNAPGPGPDDAAAGGAGGAGGAGDAGDAGDAHSPVNVARAEVDAAEAVLRDARAARAEAARRLEDAEAAEQLVADAVARLAEATAAREGAERDAEAAAAAAAARPIELMLYTLARLAAHRAVPAAGAVPVLVDDAYTHLPAGARAAVLDVLARVSVTVQAVYLTGSDDIAAWAEALPADRVLVHRR